MGTSRAVIEAVAEEVAEFVKQMIEPLQRETVKLSIAIEQARLLPRKSIHEGLDRIGERAEALLTSGAHVALRSTPEAAGIVLRGASKRPLLSDAMMTQVKNAEGGA